MSISPILVVGKKDVVLGFKTLGLAVHFWEDGIDNLKIIENLIAEGLRIIFFTEDHSEEIQKLSNKYQKDVYPMFVVIPSLEKEHTQGKKIIQDLVVQALGSASFDSNERVL